MLETGVQMWFHRLWQQEDVDETPIWFASYDLLYSFLDGRVIVCLRRYKTLL